MACHRAFGEEERRRDLAIRPPFGDERRDPLLGGGEPFRAGAAADLAELGAGLLRPARRAELLERLERRLDRLARRPLLPRTRLTTPSASSALARPNGSPTASCSATASSSAVMASSTLPCAASTSPRDRAICASTQ